MELRPLLEHSPLLRSARDALERHDPWVVGGTVRDLLTCLLYTSPSPRDS